MLVCILKYSVKKLLEDAAIDNRIQNEFTYLDVVFCNRFVLLRGRFLDSFNHQMPLRGAAIDDGMPRNTYDDECRYAKCTSNQVLRIF